MNNFATGLTVSILLSLPQIASGTITQIIDASGDGSNPFDNPVGVATDVSGNVFLSGEFSQNVFKVTAGGAISQIIDASGDGVHSLTRPYGVAVDPFGNVFVAGRFSDNVFKIAPGGTVTQILDGSGDGVHPLQHPREVATDSEGNVFALGQDSDNVFKVSPSGGITQIIDGTGDGSHPFDWPYDIVVDACDNVFVAAQASHNVFRITPQGVITQVMGASGDGIHALSTPSALAVDRVGNLFVTGYSSANLFKRSSSGAITQILDSTGDGVNSFVAPHGIAADHLGNVFASSQAHNLFRIDSGGGVVEVIDSLGDGVHPYLDPYSVAADPSGNVFVVGSQSDNAFRVTSSPGTPLEGCGNCIVDAGEDCDDGNTASNDCCDSSCQFEANGGACPPGADICMAGTCDGSGTCISIPRACRSAEKSLLVLGRSAVDDGRDSLLWKWWKGAETSPADFGSPTTGTHYALCVRDADRSMTVSIPVGSAWQTLGIRGFRFKDPSSTPDGVHRALLKSGEQGKAKVFVKARGTNLPETISPMLALPVTVQLVNDANAVCYEAEYDSSHVLKNNARIFRAMRR